MNRTEQDIIADIEKLEAELALTRSQTEIASKYAEFASKGRDVLPPGFTFEWKHRHDPFESYYALKFERDSINMEWKCPGDDRPEAYLRALEIAWDCVDYAEAVMKVVKGQGND